MTLCQLTISDLRLWVHLGCSEQEKVYPQAISIHIQFNFPSPPAGTTTDRLADTFCYLQTVENIQQMIFKHQPFSLIEHLASCIYASVYHDLIEKEYIDVSLEVRVNKLTPPVPGIQGGVTFSCNGSLTLGAKDDLYQHWF